MTAAEFAAECAEHLETIRPDLQSLTRLFGLPDSLWETEAFRFTAGTDPEGRHFECRFTAAGSGRQAARQVPVPAETGDPRLDLLHRRRALRRLCRQCCYDLLRAETGLHPAWGSLTGIRPTRLIWEQLEQGIPLAEAEKNLTVENVIERGWQFYAERDWAGGLFYWMGFDYRGEPNPLEYPAHESEFGILDYCGFWKDEAWYLKAWWTDDPVLHLLPHWNLAGHEGEEVDIWAYSNCDEVELTVNGKRLGRGQMPRNGHLKWKAVYLFPFNDFDATFMNPT